MIISASRRTDIPSYYSDWFFNRIKEGYVYTRNPMNIHQVSRISLSRDVVDGIVFWTKNPKPMFERLSEIDMYTYVFQFSITSYGQDVEPAIPSKKNVIIPAFQRLSDLIGPERIIWRYDPIMLSEKYNMNYHIKNFEKMSQALKAYTKKCTISFVDLYRNTSNNVKGLNLVEFSINDQIQIAKEFSVIAHANGIELDTCAEGIDLQQFGIKHARCIDDRLLGQLAGCSLNVEKDKNQRLECGCVSSIDIGMYNTCKNGCRYCYANFSERTVDKNFLEHNPNSALITGSIQKEDVINERKVVSCKECQASIFDSIRYNQDALSYRSGEVNFPNDRDAIFD